MLQIFREDPGGLLIVYGVEGKVGHLQGDFQCRFSVMFKVFMVIKELF